MRGIMTKSARWTTFRLASTTRECLPVRLPPGTMLILSSASTLNVTILAQSLYQLGHARRARQSSDTFVALLQARIRYFQLAQRRDHSGQQLLERHDRL